MTNIAVLVSGGGTNLQALIDAEAAGKIENGGIRLVVSSNPNAFALERAAKAGIETAVLRRKEYDSAERYGEALDALLREKEIGLIVLAGFMTVLPDSFCAKYENRIVFYLFQYRLFATADDKLSLMSRNGAEGTTAETSPVNVDGKLNHIVCRNPFPFIFRMRQPGIW